MKYCFNDDDKSLIDRILQINNVDINDLDVSNFVVDKDIDIINDFKEKLLSDKDKRFLIVGDYDCDGICATTIISKLLSDLNIKSNYYIPSRTKEGYGINNEIVEKAKDNDFGAIICVDNGVVAFEQLTLCKQYDIDTFIIDHHEYVDVPDCKGFLHPNLFDSKYQNMCAAGLSCLLANSFKYDELAICYGGLASLADMVSVFNYNRYILKQMLEIIKQGKIEPINLLLGKNEVTYENLHYNVIPKINAVSRLDDLMNVNYVVKFLLADNDECLKYYDKIETINKARKDYSKQMYELAEEIIDSSKNVIIIKHDEFKEGLCGLVANRLLSQYNKPVIVFSNINGLLKGSGRAPSGCNIYEYLCGCKDLFESFGGHAGAVGLSINNSKYDELLKYIDDNELTYEDPSKDVLLLNKSDINNKLIEDVDSLRPFGVDFVEPLLGLDNKYEEMFMVSNKYPKYKINDTLSAICFNTNLANKHFDYMVGKLSKDNYNKGKLSFIIEDLV